MQFYLHMSKKSSTFVSDLGIVPFATIKSFRVMTKQVKAKASKEREKALHRAQRIVSYHNRQLELPLNAEGVKLNSSERV